MDIDNKIKQIISDMREGVVYEPEQYTEAHRTLSGEFAYLSGHFIQCEVEKVTDIANLRKKDDIKSDAQAERTWLATDKGTEYLKLDGKLKTIKRLLTSIKLSAYIEKTNWSNEYRN
jgi:hypothetical protein